MTPLERALRERIKAEGAITLEAYMDACNAYYYATRDPLGARGDFTTAPEVSQMFGEIAGAALADVWRRAGAPSDAVYVELGPGRGTLARDALRVLRSAGFGGEVHLVETSPVLRAAQAELLPEAHWHDGLGGLPDRPLLVIANEFFDALPVRQFADGVERRVRLAAGGLAFDRDGLIVEDSPARAAAAGQLAEKLVASGGAAIVIDYGHASTSPGDTLQAIRGHRFVSVLERPGEQDLTAHVDFEAIANAARSAGASVTQVERQGAWLLTLGIEARAQALSRVNPDQLGEINAALDRLTSPAAMGDLFKIIAIHAPSWPKPAGLQ